MATTASDRINGTVTVCNAQQYNQFIQASANGSNPMISCLTYVETIGLTVSTLLVRLCPKLIYTADLRGLVSERRRCHLRPNVDCCTSSFLSHVILD